MSAVAVPSPFSKPLRHPLRFIREHIVVILFALLGAYIGMLTITAIYYLLFETTNTMNNWWHSTVPNSDLRHTIRDVGEALLGGLFGKQLAFNFYKKKYQKKLAKPRTRLDNIEIALRIPNPKDGKPFSAFQLAVTPLLVALYAAPGLLVGFYFVHFVHGLHLHTTLPVSANPTTTGVASKLEATWTMDWPKKLVGYFAAFFFGIRPARGMFADVQWIVAEQWAKYKLPTKWWTPAPFAARVSEVEKTEEFVTGTGTHSSALKRATIAVAVILFGLACFGEYVLMAIAK